MSKPLFDPNQPFESDKPAFDPNMPFESGTSTQSANSSEGFLQNASDKVSKALAFVDNPGYALRGKQPPQVNDLDAENSLTTIGNAFDKAGQYAAGKLGEAFPNHPYLDASAAMVGSTLANPLTTAGPKANYNFDTGLSPDVAAQREARTGVPARDFQRLYNDPSIMFKQGDTAKAGAEIGAAKSASGIDVGVTNDLSSLTPDNLERINPTKALKTDDINNVIGKIKSGAKPTPQEAQNALDSINSFLSQPSVQNNRDVFRQWNAIKTHINNALQDVAPEVRAANQNFADLKLRDEMHGLDAVNKSGKISKLGMMAKGGSALAGALVGHLIPGLNTGEGAYAGYLAGKYLNQAYHAPLTAGLQTAIGSYIDKFGNPILSGAGNISSQAAPLAAYLANYQNQGKQGNGKRR